ncbi:DNA-3-methyladenine glycosylase I [Halieaceae bacterium]|nr:DNA-3-methyladenine glycosylase I [Halieaceae bacterium]
MPRFEQIYSMAAQRKGGEKALDLMLLKPQSVENLAALRDSDYLSAFCKKIFQSGFVWRVVEHKWKNFEDVFWDFDIDKLLLMPDDMLERKAADPKIIRNFRKVRAIRENAQMIDETRRTQQSTFAEFIAHWPKQDMVGLWLYLKKHGSRLGGNTGPYALRALGVDTFLLTTDVEGFLRLHNIVDSGIGSQRALYAAQNFFIELQQQSGLSLCELSKLVSYCFGENRERAAD